MPIWGKVLGTVFGFMFRGPIGAVIGFIIGHFFDKGYSRDFNQMGGFSRFFTSQDELKSQAIFFHALFSLMGHIAKADGQVTDSEIRMATALMDQMNLQGDTRKEAQQAFREGKANDFPVDEVLREFKASCHGRRDVLQVFLEILIQAAFVDGKLDKKEQHLLEKAARHLGFKEHEFLYLLSMYEAEIRFRSGQGRGNGNRGRSHSQQPHYSQQQSLQDAYKILGVKESDEGKTIKKAYRKLMTEYHPDKLVSKGLPKQAIEIAKNKAQDIQSAYDLVKQVKGFK
ncbi:co-chaperone DjlA [Aliiglaciecola sp. 2_MG-2023]|uniref:co-chaperone DjlA n=1 Tax=unclassified Aliiglaciecola TaxID=2593648 RepID=UPI0026E39CDC|nr:MULTISPECIES: co-chaperone DjlA [unclassified Aliiglaciecola]MDO6712624.1 co-chaperone DjlA [Aliiglaciecola sp. 2_MG-2023]MDO6753768.1 co-chaperone DjlA [Aliiglaciecola sp. 1_MG-2023]